MASETEEIYIVKDIKAILDFASLTIADRRKLRNDVYGFVDLKVLTIAEVSATTKWDKLIEEDQDLPTVKEIFEEYTNRNLNRKFASVSLRKEDSKNVSYWYFVKLNQNLLRSLSTTPFHKLCFYLQSNVEECRLGKWCKWDRSEPFYHFKVDLQSVQGTVSDDQELKIDEFRINEDEAVNLIRRGKENLRIRFEVNIGLVRNKSNAQFQLQSIKLSEKVIIQKLFENDVPKDVTIILGSGAEIKIHRCILSAHSNIIGNMLSLTMKEGESGIFYMHDISEAAMKQLLQYFYGIEILALDLNCKIACELFQAAHEYKMKHLELSLMSVFLFREEKWFTVDSMLELYYYTKNITECKNLNEHLLKFLSRISSADLQVSEKLKKLPSSDVVELVFKLNDILRVDS